MKENDNDISSHFHLYIGHRDNLNNKDISKDVAYTVFKYEGKIMQNNYCRQCGIEAEHFNVLLYEPEQFYCLRCVSEFLVDNRHLLEKFKLVNSSDSSYS